MRSSPRMSDQPLKILCVSPLPPSPPRFGAQARTHGLMTNLARFHEVSFVSLIEDDFDMAECRQALMAYCRDVFLVPNHLARGVIAKRGLQIKSIFSPVSYDRLRVSVPALQAVLNQVLRVNRFDIVNLEFPYLSFCNFRQAPVGERSPLLVVNSHEIAYDLARQFTVTGGPLRRLYAAANWRKLKREELATYGTADGVYLCSAADESRLRAQLASVQTAVVPNAADTTYFQPTAVDPLAFAPTVLYFGLLSTVPNVDGVKYFLNQIWPHVVKVHSNAVFKIVGGRAPKSLLANASPQVVFTGFVEDIRPHLASATAVVVPLRLGGGTRLKIVEAMAMGKAIVSTTLGCEGIEAVNGRNLLLEDHPEPFAAAVNRLLMEPELRKQIGRSARQLAVEKYSWAAAARNLEQFFRALLKAQS